MSTNFKLSGGTDSGCETTIEFVVEYPSTFFELDRFGYLVYVAVSDTPTSDWKMRSVTMGVGGLRRLARRLHESKFSGIRGIASGKIRIKQAVFYGDNVTYPIALWDSRDVVDYYASDGHSLPAIGMTKFAIDGQRTSYTILDGRMVEAGIALATLSVTVGIGMRVTHGADDILARVLYRMWVRSRDAFGDACELEYFYAEIFSNRHFIYRVIGRELGLQG